jgi:hypothetical protein
MSTDYKTLKNVNVQELFDGRLKSYGVCEHINPEQTTDESRCLTDGPNVLWVYIDDEGFVDFLKRYAGGGDPSKILEAIAQAFDTDIVSEHDPKFWGFDTQEDWDAWMAQRSKEAKDRFHAELVKYLLGEPNDIRPGTVGMIEAEIAKKLVEKDCTVLLPGNKDNFLNELQAIYDREHTVEDAITPWS